MSTEQIEDEFDRLKTAVADVIALRKQLKEAEKQQATEYADALKRIEATRAEVEGLLEEREERERDTFKIEAYDAAADVVKREGLSRAQYELRIEAAEADIAKHREALKIDDELLGEIEGFLFEYDLPNVYRDDKDRVKDREELRARILLRVGRISVERYREACAENGWEADSDAHIEGLLGPVKLMEQEEAS